MRTQDTSAGARQANMFRLAGVGLVATVAYMLGTQRLLEPTANAGSSGSGDPTIIINQLTPPAIVLSANQRAVVGSADGLYYIVDYDGNSVVVKGDRRAELEWHRGPVLSWAR